MVRNGELLTLTEFGERLAIKQSQVIRMLATGCLFAIDVDGIAYIPAILADPVVSRKRLQSICRILAPAPEDCRLGYLTTRWGNLDGRAPLEVISDGRGYRRLREMARAYAAEWSRTTVSIRVVIGKSMVPTPVYVSSAEADPRENLWRRARKAVEEGGYSVLTAEPNVAQAAVSIQRTDVAAGNGVEEAGLKLRIRNSVASVRVEVDGFPPKSKQFRLAAVESIASIVLFILTTLAEEDGVLTMGSGKKRCARLS
ncbi:hypothetical protein [Paraburkholderia tropica]|uniref:hypothetical protein n=1 Tax=Paraburkholderia tropica TaxID=92647 RepID=UPI00158FCB55|nr:hypothetical protein [Paraburkholderia tropica]